jgi:hypothetical protein
MLCPTANRRFVPKSDISLSGHPKDLSYNSKPRGFYLQPGGAQNLAWWAISSIGSRTQPGGRLACWLLAKKLISTAASF